MAGVLTQSNSFKLADNIGRRPTDGELYIAHFMGAGGASKLITNAQSNPQASAAGLFPNAAAANRSIFYNRDGSARSVSQVYSVLTSRYDSAANSQVTRMAMASAGVAPGSSRVANANVPDNAAFLANFPQARTSATPSPQLDDQPPPVSPTFRSLFQAGNRPEPVSNTVRELWGNSTSLSTTAPAANEPAKANAPQGLGLFSDPTGAFSG
jgi:hypothetical protein